LLNSTGYNATGIGYHLRESNCPCSGGLGLVSVIAGWIALRRSRKPMANIRTTMIVALASAGGGLVLCVMHLVRTSQSSFGTGSGRLGAIVALVLSVVGLFVSIIALARSNDKSR